MNLPKKGQTHYAVSPLLGLQNCTCYTVWYLMKCKDVIRSHTTVCMCVCVCGSVISLSSSISIAFIISYQLAFFHLSTSYASHVELSLKPQINYYSRAQVSHFYKSLSSFFLCLPFCFLCSLLGQLSFFLTIYPELF